MLYVNAVQALLKLDDHQVYKSCRYSLVHKVIQDATYSSTDEWRHQRPEFYWSLEAVEELAVLSGMTLAEQPPERLELLLPDPAEARDLLHQEHVVPTGVVIRHLLQLDDPADAEVKAVLDCARTVCVVTRKEHGRLHKTRMPPEHADFIADRWARYRHPASGEPIRVSPYFSAWHDGAMKLEQKQASELADVPR